MEDWQFGILVSVCTAGLAGIASAVTWSSKRITRAMERNTEAMIKNTESNAILSTKIDSVAKFVRRARTTPGEGNKVLNDE